MNKQMVFERCFRTFTDTR